MQPVDRRRSGEGGEGRRGGLSKVRAYGTINVTVALAAKLGLASGRG